MRYYCFRYSTYPDKKNLDKISVYAADVIENTEGVKLNLGGFLLVALMAGGDYNQGIANCDINIAHGLAQTGLGDRLLQATQNLCSGDFQSFLTQWRQELCIELRTNHSGHLSCRHTALSDAIPNTFPDLNILEKYVRPLTSWTCLGAIPPDNLAWRYREPSISKLATFCTQHLRWVSPRIDIRKRFQAKLWEGIFMRMLYSVSRIQSKPPSTISIHWMLIQLFRVMSYMTVLRNVF